MAFLTISNVSITGIGACVPTNIECNEDAAFIATTGIERRRIVNSSTTTSDLCTAAADKLLTELGWERSSVDCLIFVSQTPDYILPATSCVLQHRLGLSTECYTADISLGCSGWVYGMSVISSLLSSGSIKRGLLLVGDTLSKITSKKDKSTWPLFGDAGTATALEFDPTADALNFHFATDGDGYKAIIIPDGGSRGGIDDNSLTPTTIDDGISRNRLQVELNGMDVFAFGISKAPKSVQKLCERFEIDATAIDYFIFHQANKFMNEKIRKKLALTSAQVPYSLPNFGNTSSASIPLTMVSELKSELSSKKLALVGCGFGVGLSWGSVSFTTNKICIPDLIEI